MTSENFLYWMQGLLELQPDLKTLDERQVELIRVHIKYVFDAKSKQQLSGSPSTVEDLLKLHERMTIPAARETTFC